MERTSKNACPTVHDIAERVVGFFANGRHSVTGGGSMGDVEQWINFMNSSTIREKMLLPGGPIISACSRQALRYSILNNKNIIREMIP